MNNRIMIVSGNRNRFTFLIFIFLFAILQMPAEENEKWDIEKVVSVGINNSFSVQTERENLLKKQLSLKSSKSFGNLSVDLKGGMVLNWSSDQGIFLSESFTSAMTFPVSEQIALISEYTMDSGSLESGITENRGSFLLGINIKPLQDTKYLSNYESALNNLNGEELSWTSSLIKTELGIQVAYIKAIENISDREIVELEFLNKKNIWKENKEKFELGLVSKITLNSSYLKKLKISESLEQSKADEYVSLLKLSRLINVDLSDIELKPLLPFDMVKPDKDQLIQSALLSSISLKQSLLKLKILKKSMNLMKNNFFPDISIIPGIEIPVTDPENLTPGISVNMEFLVDRSGKYALEKRNIDIVQQERKVKIIKNAIIDNISIALYDFSTEQKKIEYLTAFLDQKNIILSEKEKSFKENLISSTELETARIDVLNAKNDLKNIWNILWSTWYGLEAIKNGYTVSME